MVLGTAALTGTVGQPDGRAAHSERAVGEHHGFLFRQVVLMDDGVGQDEHRIAAGVHLEEIAARPTELNPALQPMPRDSRLNQRRSSGWHRSGVEAWLWISMGENKGFLQSSLIWEGPAIGVLEELSNPEKGRRE